MTKTEKLKHIILSKYNSIREFAKIVEIPSTTLTSALDKDIGGMAVDRVIKICEILKVDIKTLEPLDQNLCSNNLSKKEATLLSNFNKLNDVGKEEAIKRIEELTLISKYATTDNLCATEKPYLVACHDDDLSTEEKDTMNEKINKFLNK
ncbi:transcriptional regulator [Clostridium massiliodielmoense]|uniref:transcriptional regulator n=1 Tax=Clostridium massiliodielmoense TaxID=1776385 RepID=UPI000A268EB0|nr:transcriptional regulator [Clostridium massiliodielmoense]